MGKIAQILGEYFYKKTHFIVAKNLNLMFYFILTHYFAIDSWLRKCVPPSIGIEQPVIKFDFFE